MALLFFSILFNLTPLPPQKNKKNLVFFLPYTLKKRKVRRQIIGRKITVKLFFIEIIYEAFKR